MSKVTVHVGLDYHKGSIQVCIMDASGKILTNRSCPNRAEAFAKIKRRGKQPSLFQLVENSELLDYTS